MKSRIFTLGVCVLPYVVSLFCGVFVIESGPTTFIIGLVCLLFGWSHLAWFANPLLLGAALAFILKRNHVACCFAAAAIVVAMFTLTIEEVPKNEAGTMEAVRGYQIGFYLWLLSMLMVLLASLILGLKRRRKDSQL